MAERVKLENSCCIHRRTNHHMRSWPQHWRDDRQIMERLCPAHGVGHPDPDDLKIQLGLDGGDHGCCGCCLKPVEISPENSQK
jgi:hypothetical protein